MFSINSVLLEQERIRTFPLQSFQGIKALHLCNLKGIVTEEDLLKHFEEIVGRGSIESVTLRPSNGATVNFFHSKGKSVYII